MAAQPVVMVTGASGRVGRRVVAGLLGRGATVRAVTRDPDAAGLPGGAEVVRADLSVPDTLEGSLQGIDVVFLVWPFLTLPAEGASAFLKVVGKHARRVVFLSSMAVPDQAERGSAAIVADPKHATIESLIERSELEWTFLRASGFAANTLVWAGQIRAEGVVRWPYGAAARSLIHEADVAEVAVRALTEDGHAGASHVLTGPRALTQVEQVRTIASAIGRPLRYEELSPAGARRQLVADGWPPSFVDSALRYWATLVSSPEPVTPTVEAITGRPPRPFRDWVLDHVDAFH
jgi:uncharacterized protein YbjT (DUF2867 family)